MNEDMHEERFQPCWQEISLEEAKAAILHWVKEIKPELVRGIPQYVDIGLFEDSITIDIKTFRIKP